MQLFVLELVRLIQTALALCLNLDSEVITLLLEAGLLFLSHGELPLQGGDGAIVRKQLLKHASRQQLLDFAQSFLFPYALQL